MTRFCCWSETHAQVSMYELVYPQFFVFLTNCFAQSPHNLKVVFLIDRTTLWQEFMIHHAIVIDENSEQNLHI